MPGIDIAAPGADGPALTAALEALIPPVPGPAGPQGVQGPEGPVSTVPGPQGVQGIQGIQGPTGPSASYFLYRVDGTSTNPSDPGTGKFRYNNANQHLATELYFDWITADGFDPVALFLSMSINDEFIIQDKDLSVVYQRWRMTSKSTNMPDWFVVHAAYVDGGASFSNNTQTAVLIKAAGETGPTGPPGLGVPVGGTTGQVLVKLSDADFDTAWVDPTSVGTTRVK